MKENKDSLIEKLYARRVTGSEGTWPWILQRVTGLVIGVLVFLHLWIKHFGNPGKIITFQSSAERLHHPFWLFVAIFLIIVLLFHSFNGARTILMDYVTRSSMRRVLFWSFLGAGIFFFLVYLFFLLPFIRA